MKTQKLAPPLNSPAEPRTPPKRRLQSTADPAEKRPIISDAIYTTDEAAILCCVEPSTIRAAVRSGILRGKGRPYRFRGAELFKLV
jgi:hypothetical protein